MLLWLDPYPQVNGPMLLWLAPSPQINGQHKLDSMRFKKIEWCVYDQIHCLLVKNYQKISKIILCLKSKKILN